jgi:hypothetical protein
MKPRAIYEVRVEVDSEISTAYLEWLRRHMQQIVEIAGFERADLFTEESESPAFKVWVVHYLASSVGVIDAYLADHSKKFRADGVSRFEGRFRIERRVLVNVPDLTAPSGS